MFIRLTCLVFLAGFCALACAQEKPVEPEKPKKHEKYREEDPQTDARANREIFFRTLNEARSRGAQEFAFLLFQKTVCEEIGIDKANAKKAQETIAQARSSIGKLFEQLRDKEITGEELKVKMLEHMANADRDVWKTLVDSNSKTDRLIGLFVQHRNCSAVLNKIVAEKVGLDEAQRQEIIGKKEAEERALFEKDSRDGGVPGDRFRAWEKTQKKIDTLISGMLKAEQLEKLEQLKGEPFKFEEFPFPPGPPPGRGGREGRDGGRRDGDHEKKCCEGEMLADDR